MKRHSNEITVEITTSKMMGKYKQWKERTSTSPSARHLGHFHALFRPLKAKDDEEREKLDALWTDIIELHTLTAFKLLPHIWGRKKGSFFTGVYLPQKSDLVPPLERQYISV
jgi:hypothetical protein